MKIAPLGVPIVFKYSSLILLAMCIFSSGIMNGLFLYILLLLALLVHEYSHVWVALRNGYKVKEVQILPFGAMALIETGNKLFPPKKEFQIAIAGPVGSALLALLGYIINLGGIHSYGLILFVNINLMLAIFNMLPLYPTDGGRVLNSIIGLFFGVFRAVKISKIISIILCSIGAIACLFYSQIWIAVIFILIIIMNTSKTPLDNNK